MRVIVAGLSAAIAILSACRAQMPSTAPRPQKTSFEELGRVPWIAQRPGHCRVLTDVMLGDAGRTARSCSDARTNAEAVACARLSFERRQPFTVCNFAVGMDSDLEYGVAGLPNGNLAVYAYDSAGPKTRGLCLRPNVSFAADDWPRCKTALADLTNLRSNEPYKEPRASTEEQWPSSCSAAALRAPTAGVRIRLVAGDNVLADYDRWGLRCKDAVGFEVLIGNDGRVKCARVRSVGLNPPNPELYNVIRSRLMRWRFEPPTLHGERIEARWGMQINPRHEGDSPLPGPQIYPFCP